MVNGRKQLRGKKDQSALWNAKGKEKVRGGVKFLPVTSFFGIYFFLVDKKYYPSIVQLLLENINLSHDASLVAHLRIVITHFALVDYSHILNLKINMYCILYDIGILFRVERILCLNNYGDGHVYLLFLY